MAINRDEEPPLFKSSDFSFTKRKIEEDEDVKKSEILKTSIALRLTKYLTTTKTDDVHNIIIYSVYIDNRSFKCISKFCISTILCC
jgi:hypothetical protein